MSFRAASQAPLRFGVEVTTFEKYIATKNGTAPNGESSLAGLASALVPSLLTGIVLTFTFLFVRRKAPRVYTPRTFLGTLPVEERTPTLNATWFSWIRDFWNISDNHALNSNSLDAYLFLRFFKVFISIGLCGIGITWPILLPINATGGGGDVQLDALLIGNVKDNQRLYAHAILASLFLTVILLIITRETMFFINLRLAILSSPWYRSRISSRVVLFTSVPKDLRSENALKQRLTGVVRTWIPRDDSELKKAVHRRDQLVNGLEEAHIRLSRRAQNIWKSPDSGMNSEALSNHEDGSEADQSAHAGRPSHRLTPLIGRKVDSIHWHRQKLEESLQQISELRNAYIEGKGDTKPAAFVEFDSPEAALVAYRRGLGNRLSDIDLRYLGPTRDAIVWENLKIPFSNRQIRRTLTNAAITALIVFWTIPVAVIGSLSKINYLTKEFPFLQFVNDLPEPVLGIITGLLPQLLLSSLMSFIPNISRIVAQIGGDPSSSRIEMTTQTWYFAFSVIQVFLVTAVSSGVTSALQTIVDEPKQAAVLLARKLPTSSDFYASYFVLYGLANAPKIALNAYDLFSVTILGKLLDRTPRQVYERQIGIRNVNFGSYYPKFTTLGVIAISYSCIAPLVLGFATAGLSLLYVAFRYNILYAFDTKVDVGGHMYSRGLQQLLVGVYISELSLVGLFSLRAAFGPLVIMVLLLVLTVLYHTAMNIALGRLTKSYPTFSLDGEPASVRDYALDDLFVRFDSRLASGSLAEDLSDRSDEGTPLLSRPSPPKFLSRLFNAKLFRVPSSQQLSDSLLGTVFSEPLPSYSEKVERHAYDPPSVFSDTPKLWVARDAAGCSSKEVERTRKIIDITDEMAYFSKHGRIKWDTDVLEDLPVFKQKVYY